MKQAKTEFRNFYSAEKCKKDTLCAFLTSKVLRKIEKMKAARSGDIKIFWKHILTVPKKSNVGPFSLVQFCMQR